MQVPLPPPPDLGPPPAAEVRTVDEVLGEDAAPWLDRGKSELDRAREVADKFGEAATEWVEHEPERRKYAEELSEATRRPPGAGGPDPDARGTRRRSRAQRHR